MIGKPTFYHWTTESQVTDMIFKLVFSLVSVIYQIRWIQEFSEFNESSGFLLEFTILAWEAFIRNNKKSSNKMLLPVGYEQKKNTLKIC